MAKLTIDERNAIHNELNIGGHRFNLGWDDDVLTENADKLGVDVDFFLDRKKKEETLRAEVLKATQVEQIRKEKILEELREEEGNNFDYIVTALDIKNNPILIDFDVKVGDIIGIPKFVENSFDDTKNTDEGLVKNEERANGSAEMEKPLTANPVAKQARTRTTGAPRGAKNVSKGTEKRKTGQKRR